jgi:glycolate oxidase iron-sulfur subunit
VTTAWDEHRPPDPDLIADCVHCGFCLPTCPSYSIFEEEMDSPRGRIVLMRVGNEPGSEASDEMRVHLDRCLGCMACVTACPSGVQYDKLIEQARPQVERNAPRPRRERLYRRLIFALFTHPGRLRVLAPLLWVQQKLGVNRLLADRVGRVPELQAMLKLAPPVTPRAAIAQLPEVTPAQGTRRGRIALMQGCVQRVFFGDVNAATVRVLSAEGWEVHAPRQPRCCGSLQMHAGVEEEALDLARATIAAYEDFDAVAVNVAGCGSGMKDYAHLLSDNPAWADRAAAF